MPRITCPTCGAALEITDDMVGTTVECGGCQAQFVARPERPTGGRPSRRGEDEDDRPSRRGRRDEDGEDRPSRRRRDEEADEDERPSRRRRRDDEDDNRPSRRRRYDDEDDYDRPRRGRKPGAVTAIGGMLLGGGIYALVFDALVVIFSTGMCCLWPGVYFALVWAILAIVRGATMLGQGGDAAQGPPKVLLILQIVTILNADVVNCILGIVGLVLLNNPEVQDYYERGGD